MPLSPVLGLGQGIEREDMEATEIGWRRVAAEALLEPKRNRIRVELPSERALVGSQELDRVADANPLAHPQQLVPGTAPGSPMWMGRRVPRSHTAPIHAAVTFGSKQI